MKEKLQRILNKRALEYKRKDIAEAVKIKRESKNFWANEKRLYAKKIVLYKEILRWRKDELFKLEHFSHIFDIDDRIIFRSNCWGHIQEDNRSGRHSCVKIGRSYCNLKYEANYNDPIRGDFEEILFENNGKAVQKLTYKYLKELHNHIKTGKVYDTIAKEIVKEEKENKEEPRFKEKDIKKVLKGLTFGGDCSSYIPFSTRIISEENENRRLIAKTLLKLPNQIRRKVSKEVIFIIANPQVHGLYCGSTKTGKPRIVLNLDALERDCTHFSANPNFKPMKMSIIAHEIAHFILKHNGVSSSSHYSIKEKQVHNLVKAWGFNHVKPYWED